MRRKRHFRSRRSTIATCLRVFCPALMLLWIVCVVAVLEVVEEQQHHMLTPFRLPENKLMPAALATKLSLLKSLLSPSCSMTAVVPIHYSTVAAPPRPVIVAVASLTDARQKHHLLLLDLLATLTDACVTSVYDADDLQRREGCSLVFVSTHQPLRTTHANLKQFDKTVYLMQNPLDYVEANLAARSSREEADVSVRAEAKSFVWRRHVQHWEDIETKRRQEQQDGTPVLWLRLEDLLVDPREALERVLAFVGGFNALQHEADCLIDAMISDYDSRLRPTTNRMSASTESARYVAAVVQNSTLPYICKHNYGVTPGHPPCSLIQSAPDQIDPRLLQSGEYWWLPMTYQNRRKVHLLTTYFAAKTSLVRQSELDQAFLDNFHNPNIDSIHLWVDYDSVVRALYSLIGNDTTDRLRVTVGRRQPLYSDLFKYANMHMAHDIVILQNADIVWPLESPLQLHRLTPGVVYALSRQPQSDACPHVGHNRNFCLNYAGSHDAFAFIPPIDPDIIADLAFKQNTWGGENVVVERLKYGGWLVENPCHDVPVYHLHCSGVRRGTGKRKPLPAQGDRASRKSRTAVPRYFEAICRDMYCRPLDDLH